MKINKLVHPRIICWFAWLRKFNREYFSNNLVITLKTADVIIAQGQATVETRLDTGHGYNVYYAFLVKCKRFIDRFGKAKLTPMLVRERDL